MEAIYARQSLDKKDSLSIDGQIRLCRGHAAGDPLIFSDKGYSGKNTNRPAFTALLEAVEAGTVQKILVYRLDRFSRSIADFSRIWDLLEKHGVQFLSVTEQFDTASPMGRAMLNILMTFAQLERETTAQRVKDNYRHRVTLGAWPGGPAPYGFSLSRQPDENGHFIPTLTPSENAGVVREIFCLYPRPGLSLRSLARELTARGIPGPKRETWDSVTLSRILHSPLYVRADPEVYRHYLSQGVTIPQPPEAFDGYHACTLIGRRNRSQSRDRERPLLAVAGHPGIIESALWLEVQEKLAANRQLDRTGVGTYSWLTGLLKCGKCGYALKINRSGGRLSLLCSGRSNLGCCDASLPLRPEEVEAAVGKALREMLAQCPPEVLIPEDSATAAECQSAEEKIRRLVQALAESNQSTAEYITTEIDRLHARREALQKQMHSGPTGASCRLNFDQTTFAEKKRIAALFIDRILVTGDEISILWNL